MNADQPTPAELLTLFGTGLSQQSRLIELSTAQGSGLRSAKDLSQRLSNASAQSQAQALHSPQGGNSLERFMAQIDPAQQGKLGGPLNGQSTLHDPQGSRDLKEPVNAFGAPVMVLDTPFPTSRPGPPETAGQSPSGPKKCPCFQIRYASRKSLLIEVFSQITLAMRLHWVLIK